MDTQITMAARAVVKALTEKELRVFVEAKDSRYEENRSAVTILMPSGKRIRIRTSGEVVRPDLKKAGELAGNELGFFRALKQDPGLAVQVRKGLMSAHFVKRDNARTAAQFAEEM